MTIKLGFDDVRIAGLVLAKVGNPSRDEPLVTSKQVLKVEDEDQAMLSSIFLRPFKSLGMQGHRFHHHTSLESHELNKCAAAMLADDATLLERGCEIAKRLYSKSSHPNIKSGDLCISLIEGIDIEGEPKKAICILKSESVTPFLSISARDGDLQLSTEQGINPEKIDKGCLILDHFSGKGYYVLTFDRAGAESRFWVRDFLSVVPIADPSLMTKKVAEMAMAAVGADAPAADDDSPPWEVNNAAQEALSYFDGKKKFSLQEFEEQALRTPEAKAKFAAEKRRLEEEEGVKVDDAFDISKRDVVKAKKGMKSMMKLDTGVEIKLKPKVVDKPDAVLEKGFDEAKGMKFIKVYYNKDLLS
ncbi:nucleoid-associated protein [Haloferula chungangensis]|uniref:Nucleoid-associated protein n=1 Tax=Haloferula chungangensis TaxID=1048331 RepID=A0ABW2L6V3_9BACT